MLYLAELIISVCCLDKDLDGTVALLKKLDLNTAASGEYEGLVDEEDNHPQYMPRKLTHDWSDIPF